MTASLIKWQTQAAGVSPPAPSGYGTYLKPFASTSPIRIALADVASTTYATSGETRTAAFRAATYKLRCESNYWTIPVYVATASDPIVYFYISPTILGYGDAFPGTSVPIPLPAGAYPSTGNYTGFNGGDGWADRGDGDFHLVIIDPDGIHAHELWNARHASGGSYRAASYAKVKLANSGVVITEETSVISLRHNTGSSATYPASAAYGWGAPTAAGISALAGLIRGGEITNYDAPQIDHMIAMSLPPALIAQLDPFYPAGKKAFNGTGPIRYSQMFAIPASVNIETLGLATEGHKRLGRALQTRGIISRDQSGGNVIMYAERQAAAADAALLNSSGSSMDLLHANLVAVDWTP